MKTKRDEPLEEIWAIRRRIAERHGGDPREQARRLRQRQHKEKDRLFQRENSVSQAK